MKQDIHDIALVIVLILISFYGFGYMIWHVWSVSGVGTPHSLHYQIDNPPLTHAEWVDIENPPPLSNVEPDFEGENQTYAKLSTGEIDIGRTD